MDLDYYPISENEINDDVYLIQLANKCRLNLSSSPKQSNFRVYALLIIKTISSETAIIIHGTNSEADYIGSSICAERSAIVKLRYFDNPKVLKVVVVTDLMMAVSPGMLCREYLMSVCDDESRIIMAGANAQVNDDIVTCYMKDLFPHPYLYRTCDRSNIIDYAKNFALKHNISSNSALKYISDDINFNTDHLQKLYQVAIQHTKYDDTDSIHPLRLACACLYDDNSIEVTWMLKGLEYGCTIDAVSQMVSRMIQQRLCGDCKINISNDDTNNDNIFKMIKNPIMLVNCDQFGIIHAPHAASRALLTEHGFNNLNIMIHNDNGMIQIVSAESLVPNPNGSTVLSHDSFQ